MKVNLKTKLQNQDGTVVESQDKDGKVEYLTVGTVISNALLASLEEDKDLDGEAKYKLFRLWSDKCKPDAEVSEDLEAEDIVTIKKRVGKMYSALVVGQVYDLLENKSK